MTPILIGTDCSPAASATALMWAGFLIFPGLSRRQSTPEAIAAKAILYWLWTSATIGTGDLGTICAKPSAASKSLHVHRTMSAPAAASE